MRDRLLLWVAQGFGVGRIPFAPGTWGSAVGLLWTMALLAPGSPALYAAGTVGGLALSVWLCGEGERILGRKDPGSVVWDEIAAMPLCFAACVGTTRCWSGGWLTPGDLFAGPHWAWTVGTFAAFRVFDIAKPWPIRQSQILRGGWGVTVDDALAAVDVNLVWLAVFALRPH